MGPFDGAVSKENRKEMYEKILHRRSQNHYTVH